MNKNCVLLFASFLIFLSPFTLFAQPGTWAISGGGPFAVVPTGIEVDAIGNTYICGNFQDNIQIGNTTLTSGGYTDMYVAKYDTSGNVVWATKYGWERAEMAYDLSLDPFGNIYLAFQFRDSIVWNNDTVVAYYRTADLGVLKMDTSGNFNRFTWEGGRGREFPYDIECDGLGNVVMTGVFRSHTIFGLDTLESRGFDDIFITVMDSNLQFQWGRQIGGKDYDDGLNVSVVDDTIYYVSGYISDTAYVTDDSSQYLVSAGRQDLFVAKYSKSGIFYWAKRGGGPGDDQVLGLQVSDNEEIYVAGRFDSTMVWENLSLTSEGGSDGFLMQLNSNGEPQWGKRIGGKGFDAIQGMDRHSNGQLYVTGFFQGSALFDNQPLEASDSMDTDAFWAAYDGSGTFLFANSDGSPSYDQGSDIVVDHIGNSRVYGTFTGTAQFGQTTLVSAGSDDYFLLRVGPTGKVSREQTMGSSMEALFVYPNPFREELTLSPVITTPTSITWELIDLQGRVVNQGARHLNAGRQRITLPLGALPAGLYLYRLTTETDTYTGKVIKH